jgi:uncharacterized protein YndB with AHSA1/START domain
MTMTVESVRKSIVVEASQARAFEVFTAGFDTWWPHESHHIGDQAPERVVVEDRAGGRCYEIAPDGSECQWGSVVAYEPPERIVIGWQLTADWKFDPDFLTEVEVRFIAEGESRTRVELEQRDLERYGERAGEIRSTVGGEGGWPGLLERFAAIAGAA